MSATWPHLWIDRWDQSIKAEEIVRSSLCRSVVEEKVKDKETKAEAAKPIKAKKDSNDKK